MTNVIKVSQMPASPSATLSDLIYDIQSGVSEKSTLQQVFNLMLANTVLNHAGNPNGAVAGVVYQFCWDTTNSALYICSTSGTSGTAIWTLISTGFTSLQTWTPTFTFATPGDLSVMYNDQVGYYSRVGDIVSTHFQLSCTPTFTTSSGEARVGGFPFPNNVHVYSFGSCLYQASSFPAGVNSTFLQLVNGQSYCVMGLNGSGVAAAYITATQATSGGTLNIQGSITYLV